MNKLDSSQIGKLEPRSITDEMSQSYLDYAMSVIVSRALPDVRDGLKPVQRRILFAMNEMGLRSKAKFTKSAKIVGEVLGKYHPHGDQAVYDTLARMVQDFSMRYPLVNGQGNFGSVDGDSPAAMRYTEAKMQALSEEFLADIDKDTVDFAPNYDGTKQEPRYMPTRVPNLLLNGALGIAVGMATNIPPHNLSELVKGIKALIDNPELTIDDLIELVPGPDFPTGATIYGREDIKQVYATGRGPIVIRANATIKEKKKSGYQIIISALPYQVNKADLIAKIANLVKLKKIDGISDIRDESDRNEKVRVVIELKANAYPKKVLNRLYDLTPMQTVFHVNLIALQEGIQPRLFNLKEALWAFIDHRTLVINRRTRFELAKAQERLHILEGLSRALDEIDLIINTIRSSKTRETAKVALRKKFKFSEMQVNAILDMRLSALAGLERQKVLDELQEKRDLIKKLNEILASPDLVKKIIKDELDEVSAKFSDERRTKIVAARLGDFSAEDLIPNEQVVITLTTANYIKRVPINSYRSQKRGGKGILGMTTKEEDEVKILRVANTHDDILFFTSKGRIFKSKVYELPSASRQAKGTAIVNLIQLAPNETVTSLITLSKDRIDNNKYLFYGTRNGIVKKTAISAYKNIRKSGIIALKLRDEDELRWVRTTSGEDSILIVTQKGQAIHFNESDVRPMGRGASGVRGIKLRENDEVIALDTVREKDSDLLVVSEKGFGKRTATKLFAKQKRGGFGLRAAKITSRTGRLVAASIVTGNEGELVMVSSLGQTIRLPLKSVKRLGRSTQGVTLMRFKATQDHVASMTFFKANKLAEALEQKEGSNQK